MQSGRPEPDDLPPAPSQTPINRKPETKSAEVWQRSEDHKGFWEKGGKLSTDKPVEEPPKGA